MLPVALTVFKAAYPTFTHFPGKATNIRAPKMANERIFEIGIALAGGSTRGAYSAGVMDFFIQALNEWEKARIEAETQQPKEPLPPWHVRMKAMTGTSAGGITAAIATSSIGTPTTPLPNNYVVKDPVPAGNNLFKVWVKDVSVDTLDRKSVV